MRQENKNHFLYLDGMRGVAAIFVGFLHETQILMGEKIYHLPNAHLAVDFFFCLSGFVISYNYSGRIGVSISTKDFLLARVIRLYPLMLMGVLEGAFVLIIGSLRRGGDATDIAVFVSVVSIAMFPAGLLIGRSAFPPNNCIWSLFFEFMAYISYGLFSIRGKRNFLLAVFALAAFLVITVALYGDLEFLGFYNPEKFWGGFARVGFPFAAGVLIDRLGLYRNRHVWLSWIAFAALPVILGFSLGTWINDKWLSDLAIVILVIPLLVMAGTAPANARIAPYLKLLGEVSYPFYLIHEPILRALKTVPAIERLVMLNPLGSMALITLAIAVLALAASRLYDIPVRRRLTSIVASREMSRAHATAI
jgi:peptidoglycan/LPS O-acetylase OafA/YrhL